MSTDIIIVTWNGREDTIRAIESIHRQIGRGPGRVPDVKVTVVDNGSTDGTSETIARRFPGVGIIRLTENRGFTGGVRAGAEASKAESLILLNNDAVVEERWLASMTDALADAPEDVVAVSGRILDLDGERADFVGGVMTFDGHGFQPGFHKPIEAVEEPGSGDELLFACGGNMIVRRELFLELGGFDDDYFAYLEDVDFGWRAWLSGYRILYSREGSVRHRSAGTSRRLGNYERGVLFEKNAAITMLKNLEEPVFREMSASIFLTLLHREHRYLVDHNDHRGELDRAPLGHDTPQRRPSLFRRLADRFRQPRILLGDPLTVMQVRATEWIFRNLDAIMDRRARVQSRRVRSDEEIFTKFPMAVVPTYPGDEQLFDSSLFTLLGPVLPTVRRTLGEMTED